MEDDSREGYLEFCEQVCGSGNCDDLNSDDLLDDEQCERNSFYGYIDVRWVISNDSYGKQYPSVTIADSPTSLYPSH